MIEAELKARVRDDAAVRALLRAAAGEPERAEYADTYFDRAGELAASGRELWLRTVTVADEAHTVLTYKGGAVEEESGARESGAQDSEMQDSEMQDSEMQESEAQDSEAQDSEAQVETAVADRAATEAILAGLGYAPVIAFRRRCENYGLATATGRAVLATLVAVPELAGVYLEVETAALDEADMRAGLDELRALLSDLGVGPRDLTSEPYSVAVAALRPAGGPARAHGAGPP